MFNLVDSSWLYKSGLKLFLSKHSEILIELSSDLWIKEKQVVWRSWPAEEHGHVYCY